MQNDSSTLRVRQPAVAGMFYPQDPRTLQQQVHQLLNDNTRETDWRAKVIVAPHAGYKYSGSIASSVYAPLKKWRSQINRVVILSPAHRYGFAGIACSQANVFRTPLGDIHVAMQSLQQLQADGLVQALEQAFEGEHALEVHLPFLQTVLAEFEIIPLIVGQTNPQQVSRLLDCLWGDENTLIVISSDLSHFHDYDSARRLDRQTVKIIEQLDYAQLTGDQACGVYPLRGLLQNLQQRHLSIHNVDLRNSGDTAGDKERVVGYGAFEVFEMPEAPCN